MAQRALDLDDRHSELDKKYGHAVDDMSSFSRRLKRGPKELRAVRRDSGLQPNQIAENVKAFIDHGVKRILVMTEHTTKAGEPKIVAECTYPLTGKAVVDRIYTNLAVLDVTDDGLVVRELAPGSTFEEVRAKTGAPLLPLTQESAR